MHRLSNSYQELLINGTIGGNDISGNELNADTEFNRLPADVMQQGGVGPFDLYHKTEH